jgi:hypothetical protein
VTEKSEILFRLIGHDGDNLIDGSQLELWLVAVDESVELSRQHLSHSQL